MVDATINKVTPKFTLASTVILDLQCVIRKWINNIHEASKLSKSGCFANIFKTGKNKNFMLNQLDIEYVWDNVKFTQEEGSFNTESQISKNLSERMLFQTSFDNRTSIVQETVFRTGHEIAQTYEFIYNRSFSTETNASSKVPFPKNIIKLIIPVEIIEFSGSVKKDIYTECGENQITEDKV